MRSTLQNRYFFAIARLLILYLFAIVTADGIYQLSEIHGEGGTLRHEVGELLVLLTSGLIMLPLLLLATYRLSTRMLHPLQNIRETADRIIAGRLEERIQADNPNDDLGRLTKTINSAFDRYRDAVSRQQRFASDASHQLRTPLTSIRAAGEISLRMQRTPEEYRETIGSMLEDVQRLSDVVEKLLMLARLGADHVRASFTHIMLDAQVTEVVRQFEIFLSAKNIQVRQSGGGDFPVQGDAALIQQMIANLLDNAVRHAPDGSEIRIILMGWAGNRVALTIRDDGPGVPAGLRERLFQRFAQPGGADNLGSGIGLSIVSEIASLHGGEIELLDGPGATFRVLLPLT